MSNESSSTTSGGIGVLGLLGITEVSAWSWWYVTMPFWGGIALVLGILGVVLLFAGIGAVIAAVLGK